MMPVFGLQTLCYVYCQFKRDNSYIDTAWPLSFLLPHAIMYLTYSVNEWRLDKRSFLLMGCITLWALRLAFHIACRHAKNGQEDYRYQYLRKRMNSCGAFFYYIQSFFLIFMLQAGLACMVNYPLVKVMAYSTRNTGWRRPELIMTDYAGFSLFFAGFAMETIADYQLN